MFSPFSNYFLFDIKSAYRYTYRLCNWKVLINAKNYREQKMQDMVYAILHKKHLKNIEEKDFLKYLR